VRSRFDIAKNIDDEIANTLDAEAISGSAMTVNQMEAAAAEYPTFEIPALQPGR
jgi:hypothetical protein